MLTALKEELFLLETERLQRHISEGEYRNAKSALELVLGRVLQRRNIGSGTSLTGSAAMEAGADEGEPVQAGSRKA